MPVATKNFGRFQTSASTCACGQSTAIRSAAGNTNAQAMKLIIVKRTLAEARGAVIRYSAATAR
jgi:hypothetical protein